MSMKLIRLMIGRKRTLAVLTAAVFVAACAMPRQAWAEKAWIDVTGQYLTNPGFDGNSSHGWTWTSNAHSQTLRCEAMEFWNGTWRLWQTIDNLPAGDYRLSVQSYYRCGDNDWAYRNYLNGQEDITGRMFAGDFSQPLVSIYSYHFPSNDAPGGCWGYKDSDLQQTLYFPNTMETGTEAFSRGAYENQMTFTHEGGSLDVGLINETMVQSNWCLFDNFRLEYFGEVVIATGLSLNPSSVELIKGQTCAVEATVTPANTTYRTLEWSSSNERVATVDDSGLVTAVETGQATITARTTDGSRLSASVAVSVVRSEATAESLVVNEIMASNVDEFISPAFNFDGWMELYNPTGQAVELGRIYISDDASDLKKWRTPASMGVLPAHRLQRHLPAERPVQARR